jgi:hypothetical protein
MVSSDIPPSGSVTATFVGMSSPRSRASRASSLISASAALISTAGRCNAEASRRYLLESRALDSSSAPSDISPSDEISN